MNKKMLLYRFFIFNFLFNVLAVVHMDGLVSKLAEPLQIDYLQKDEHSRVRIGFSDDVDDRQDKTYEFCEEYLKKYYPKVFVIREKFFSHMSPDELDASLAAIVAILTEKPWYYFADSPDKIKITIYWEHILDQCSLISDFLKKARVDLETNCVFLPVAFGVGAQNNYFNSFYQAGKKQNKLLFTYFKEKNKTAYWDFYALCFDYLIKLFNEGFLLRDLRQVAKYLHELEFVMGKLRGTKYEKTYEEAMKNCRELVALLKSKISDSKDENDPVFESSITI